MGKHDSTVTDDGIAIISLDERDRWEAEHRRDGLPSQSWAYAHALRAMGIEPTLAVVRAAGARMLLPFFERSWNEATDIATTIGLSGASIVPSSPAPLVLWREYAHARGWVAGYLRLAVSVSFEDDVPDVGLVPNRTVFLLDLARRNVLKASSEIVRRKVRKASRLGAVLVDDRARLADRLKDLHPDTMVRADAGPEYAFPAQALEQWAPTPARSSSAGASEVRSRRSRSSASPAATPSTT